MTAKIKILIIAITVSVGLLCFLKYSQYRNIMRPPELPKSVDNGYRIDNLTESKPEPNHQDIPAVIHRELTLKEIIQQGHGNDAYKASAAMEEFLKTWNPVGHTTQELIAIFGEPYQIKPNHVLYNFDNGEFGWNFDFVYENGKITELRRPPSE